jgi:hypothetical protein
MLGILKGSLEVTFVTFCRGQLADAVGFGEASGRWLKRTAFWKLVRRYRYWNAVRRKLTSCQPSMNLYGVSPKV